MGARPVWSPGGAQRGAMLSTFSRRQAWLLGAMLTAVMAVVALGGCEWQTAVHAPMPACPEGHQHACAPHTTLDLMCVMATLPMGVALAPVSLVMLYAMELVWHPSEFASPPFIPPRHVLVAVGGNRRPGGSSLTLRRRTSVCFANFQRNSLGGFC